MKGAHKNTSVRFFLMMDCISVNNMIYNTYEKKSRGGVL